MLHDELKTSEIFVTQPLCILMPTLTQPVAQILQFEVFTTVD